jgi:acyl-homoserine-lactone acylase
MADRGGLTVRDLQRQQFADRGAGGTATGRDGGAVDVREACAVLAGWDRTMDTGSRGALLFDRFWRKLTAAVPAARLWKVPFSTADPVRTPRDLDTAAPGFATALADAVTELRAAGVPLDARLGEHQFVVLSGTRIPVPGGSESLGVWNRIEPVWDAARGGYTEVTTGSSCLQAVGWDGSGCPVVRTLLTYSQSSNPRSPHFSDQTRLFSGGRWATSRFCERDIRSSPALKVVRVRGR